MDSSPSSKPTTQFLTLLSRRNFIQQASAYTAGTLLVGACKPMELSVPGSPQSTSSALSTNSIACYGDSLTEGIGGTRMSVLLMKTFPDRIIENYGISGQDALEIATRQGSQPLLITLKDNAFAGAGPVLVTDLSTKVLYTPDTNDPSSLSGTLGGVRCVLTRTATGMVPNQIDTYTVSPLLTTKQAIPANSQLYLDSAQRTKSVIQTLWLGRNNVPNLAGVADLINQCILYLDTPRRFVVIGVLSAVNEYATANNAILSVNALLEKTYPTQYISPTPPTADEMASLNYSPTQQDLADIAAGFIPRGMRVDGLHMTTVGYQLIANRIAALIRANNW